METLPLTLFKDVIDGIQESGGDTFKFCYQCGLCETVCPWNSVRQFFVRRIINQAKLGEVDFGSEDLWLCATCGRCPQRCPRGVEIIDVMRAMRRLLVPDGVVPACLRSTISCMRLLWSRTNDYCFNINFKHFSYYKL